MKNYIKYISLLILLMLFVNITQGQSWYYFSGNVVSQGDSLGIPFYELMITDNQGVNVVTYTNENGFYSDSVFLDPITQTIVVGLFDCMGEFIYHDFTPPQEENNVNFIICTADNSCDAMFIYYPDNINYKKLNFLNISIGNYTSSIWDFGDGNISYEENPEHTYENDGEYIVNLTIHDSTNGCESTISQSVNVNENDTTLCYADFTYELSEGNHKQVYFTEMSSPNIDYWYWNFGDGQFSEDTNPVHTYETDGVYSVVLSVMSNQNECNDIIVKQVSIFDSATCIVDFNYQLDTINNTPYTYIFDDASSEGITDWLWDFGDGEFSNESNPVHVFNSPGTYTVCLTAIYNNPSGFCDGTICKQITTPSYYNFGGQVFIDGFTINIEENDSSNIATAYLYRRLENKWEYMDKREFWKYGYYWFVQKPEGEYLLRFDLELDSKDYDFYAPSYYKNQSDWRAASTFLLKNNEQFEVNVNLKQLVGIDAGIGSISGNLISGQGCNSEDVSNRIIKLFFNEEYVAYVKTNGNGEFEFLSLPSGLYRIEAEVSGRLSSTEFIQLDDNQSYSDGHILQINCNAFVGVEENEFSETGIVVDNVFPNPATDFVNFKVYATTNQDIEIELMDVLGRKIGNYNMFLNKEYSNIKINIKNISAAIVIYRVKSSDGKIIESGKLIRNHN